MSFSSPIWLLALLLVPLGAGRPAPRPPPCPAVRAALPGRAHGGRGAGHAGPTGAGTSRSRWPWPRSRRWASRWPARMSPTRVPVREASVVLVLDRSGSMDANDVQPTRLSAAERAANTFVDQLPSERARRCGHVLERARRGGRADDRPRGRAPGDRLADGRRRDRDRRRAVGRAQPPAQARRATPTRRSCCCPTAPPTPGRIRSRWPPKAAKREDRDLHGRARHRERIAARTPIRSARRSRSRPTRS